MLLTPWLLIDQLTNPWTILTVALTNCALYDFIHQVGVPRQGPASRVHSRPPAGDPHAPADSMAPGGSAEGPMLNSYHCPH